MRNNTKIVCCKLGTKLDSLNASRDRKSVYAQMGYVGVVSMQIGYVRSCVNAKGVWKGCVTANGAQNGYA